MKRSVVHIIDDDSAVREGMSEMLKRHGYGTYLFANAYAFLVGLDELPAGCILLDITMPGMDGIQLLKELRLRGRLDPIIFVSGAADVRLAVQAMKEGAIDFLRKPADPYRLVRAVESALGDVRS